MLLRYLASTATFLCNNFMRKRLRRGRRERPENESSALGDPMAELPEQTAGVVTRAALGEVTARIRACLDGLPRTERDVVALRLVERRSHAEIAQLTQLPRDEVGRAYRRGLARLRDSLPAELFDELSFGRGAAGA